MSKVEYGVNVRNSVYIYLWHAFSFLFYVLQCTPTLLAQETLCVNIYGIYIWGMLKHFSLGDLESTVMGRRRILSRGMEISFGAGISLA